jgi:hypothetical protein
MNSTNTWWKEMFSGELSVGLNDNKTYQLKDESFLYHLEGATHSADFEEEDLFE